ncbi:helix-turn-helix domain-containing protein [Niabella soli]|uniref:XRE family transcriptional regulator n=1 Tax=Niabella soli DSM 19437 TaxID=929713 RepID=W0F0Q9_9BACT|nr:helix-turn-helix transcriptional regulator [Niabella soli]AHF14926.1 XRE family transcriptional regulator [Niabella soli DSM 19437]
MQKAFDIEQLVEAGAITNELDYERAMIADRKLRLLAKESVHFKKMRSRLRNLIAAYEKKEWNKQTVADTAKLAESERIFIENRKTRIKKELKALDLTQEQLAAILGHKSKTHMSELINGVKPFQLTDLLVISKLLKIDMKTLIPPFLSAADRTKVLSALQQLNNPKLEKRAWAF